MPKYFLYLLVGLLAGCATYKKGEPFNRPPVALTSEETDIYVALLKHQFAHNASGTQRDATTYFVEIQEADPSADLLVRFAHAGIPVEKASEAYYDRHAGVHRKSGKKFALLFMAGRIRWLDRDTVEISGGYHEGDLSASGNIYRLTRTRSGWKVTSDRMEWIS